MTDFFTSDLHFGHLNIIEYAKRPFRDVEHMNQELVDRWNDVVSEGDRVWILGDACMGRIDDSLSRVTELNGEKWLICGNHDRPWMGWHYKTQEKRNHWLQRYQGVFDKVIQTTEHARKNWKLEEHNVLLSHFPYKGEEDHVEGRDYSRYSYEDRGGWLLHGHVHDAWRVRGRQINVGVDKWDFTPVSATVLADLVASGKKVLDTESSSC